MLPHASTYDDLVRRFRWRIPDRFNIGVAACDVWADRDPARVAIEHKTADGSVESVTYGQLRDRSNRFANVLRSAGIGRGDRVALLLPQCPETAIAHLAVYKLGAIAVPLASLFGVDALEYRLTDSGARALVTDEAGLVKVSRFGARPETLEAVFSIGAATAEARSFHGEIDRAAAMFDPADTGPDDPALIIYTSGTTGSAKGALHGHRVLLGHLPGVEMPHEFFPQDGDVMWTPADWAWAGGLLNVLLPSLFHGVKVIAYRFEKFDPELAFSLIAEFGVRNAFIPPTALRMMRKVPDPRRRWNLSLRTIGSGGEALGREVYDWARETLGLTVNEFYGQTEANLVLSSCAAVGVSRSGAIGKPVPGHDVAVIDEDGNVLAPGEIGQIAVRRPDPVMFLEYWGRREATEAKFVGDWMKTGDQGVVDEDGYFSFVGRDDDVITSAGYRIGPGEIEDCLISHPAVALAAVVGKPDPVRTEIVKAFIVPREGVVPSDELVADIQAFVRDRLAAHEYPREIAFLEELPLTTTGKVIRRLLRDRA
ncbi:acyl-CoA synthetase [Microbaculum marinum]|uniref:Acyl-CoA synthetase n=1 Tax=Microbaculum marinum TaxID=1764581 RepID=A0AAW9RN55_9HYPH